MPTIRSRPSPRPPAARKTFDEAHWRATHATREYIVPGLDYDDYSPAYRYGMLVKDKHGNKEFVEVEPQLAAEWPVVRGASPLSWSQARPAVQEAYVGVVKVRKVKSVRAATTKKARTARASTVRRTGTTTAKRGPTKVTVKTKSRTTADNLRKRGAQDRARINVNESWEVDYWTRRLGVTAARLRQAVKKVGPMATDVRRELGK